MLNTKVKQIEMDTIQQEPLFIELTPEAAATVEGGILFTTVGVTSKLNIRNLPNLRTSKVIGSFKPGAIFSATDIVTNGFRRLSGKTSRWVSTSFIKRYRP